MLEVVSPVFHKLPDEADEVITIESPWQNVNAEPLGVTMGGAGVGFTVTRMELDNVEEQPKLTR